MRTGPEDSDEAARRRALAHADILPTAPDPALDDIARLAAWLCRAPIALISLVDRGRQWFPGRAGVDGAEADQAVAFCEATMRGRELLLVPDALADARFAANPPLDPESRLRFYAGMPLVGPDGHALGTLSVIDRVPRQLSDEQKAALAVLARQVASQLALRRRVAEISRTAAEIEARHHGALGLAEVGRLFSEALDPEVVGQRVADTVRSLLAVESTALYGFDPGTDDLTVLTTSRLPRSRFEWSRVVPRGAGVTGIAVSTCAAVASRGVLADVRFPLPPEARHALEQAGDRAMLAVPLIVKDRVIGALAAADPPGRTFAEADVRLAQALADQAALALENARLYADTERRRREAEIVAKLSGAINSTLDLDTILQQVTERARELCESDVALIALRPTGGEGLVLRYWSGAYFRRLASVGIEPGRGIGALVVASGGPFRTDHYAGDPRIRRDFVDMVPDEGPVTLIAVPIRLEARVDGVLYAYNRSPRPFTDRDEAVLLRLAEHAAVAIQNASLFAREQKARVAAEASEQRFRGLFDGVPVGLLRSTPAGRITDANPTLVQMLGYPDRESLLAVNVMDLYVDPDERARFRALLERDGVVRGFAAQMRRYDGTAIWVEDNIKAVPDAADGVVYYEGSITEITERKLAEQALGESNHRILTIFESITDAFFALNHEWQFTYLNRQAELWLRRSRVELLGKTMWEAFPQAVGLRFYPEYRRAVSEQIAVSFEEYYPPLQTWFEVHAYPSPDGLSVYFRDITERKRSEEALRQSERQFRQAQKMEAVGQLAGGIAHDFNNLLTVIIGRGEMLLRRPECAGPARHDVELIQKTAERAADLTRQLLAFSRKQVLQPKVLDLNSVVTGMATMLRRLIGEHIDLVMQPGAGLGRVKADPAQIEQVIMNLVVNSRDAMPEGGTLSIRTGNAVLDDEFVRGHPGARPGSNVLLGVADTGCGIEAEVQAHIFEPFFTTKEQGKGTGLGLSTVYGIVKQHEGYIAVDSEVGRGTTFTIYLPRVEDAVEPDGAGAEPDGSPRGEETVLLVEDEGDVRELAREILEKSGYAVLEAANGPDALRLAARHEGVIHLLLTDVVMPQMSGRELARRLVRKRPEVRVLYTSGYVDEGMMRRSVVDRDTALLKKPFSSDALVRSVREVLDGRPPVR